ncbi:MAG: cation:proton antiporter, partial [Planctomycetaceae bacterium]|nr:cation:proton antiporter [Planctomycetaceae bacterium]
MTTSFDGVGSPELQFRRHEGSRRPRKRLSLRGWCGLLALCAVTAGGEALWSASTTAVVADDERSVTAPEISGGSPSEVEHPSESEDAEDGSAEHATHAGGHTDPVAPLLMAIIIVLFVAKVGGDLFERVGMPAVLGELVVGVLLGNMALMTGWHGLDFLKAPEDEALRSTISKLEEHQTTEFTPAEQHILVDPEEQSFYHAGAVLKMLAALGVILLLFEVGLESSVRGMLSVGVSSMVVAVMGVVAPMVLGYGASSALQSDVGWQVHAFVGATLSATSVGITARVLKDLGRSQQRESQIILGAAVIDDVLGLIVLAIVSGVIQQGANFNPTSLVWIVAKSFGFLLGAIVLGNVIFTRPLFRAASYLHGHGLLVVTSLVICFGFSWLASQMGLATIVGAFAAGLILEQAHYRELGHKESLELEEALRPLSAVLIPIFFVQMGIMVDLSSFKDPSVWGFAAAITAMAIVGKLVCAWGVTERGLNRLAVGFGMIPRGEVGLIFASEGAKLKVDGEPVINAGTYSAVVVMVMLTTMITPPILKWALIRGDHAPRP